MFSTFMERGRQTLILWPVRTIHNRHGEAEYSADLDNPIRLRVTTSEDRSQIADLPGQVDVDIMRVISRHYPGREGGTWSRCRLDGVDYDLAEPPRFSPGPSKASEHWEFKLRSRADLASKDPGPIFEVPLFEGGR